MGAGDALEVQGQPVIWNAECRERLRALAVDGFERSKPVGEEVAGVLYGREVAGVVYVVASQPLDREDATKPALPLTANEVTQLTQLVALREGGLEAVGWFRSRTRGMAALSPEDFLICERFFGRPGRIAIILRPRYQRPLKASLLRLSRIAESDFSQHGLEIELDAPSVVEALPMAQTLESAAEMPAQPLAQADVPRSAAGHAFFTGMILAAGLVWFAWKSDRSIGLDAAVTGDTARLSWNPRAGFLSGATGANITAGDTTKALTIEEFRTGSMELVLPASDVRVSIEVVRGDEPLFRAATLFAVQPSK